MSIPAHPRKALLFWDRLYYSRDHLRSIREVTDDSGSVRVQYTYDPYGQSTGVGSESASFGFDGYYSDAARGLYLAMHRPYSADSGRWLSRDPVGESGGINLYGFVQNDPVNKVDPLGLEPYIDNARYIRRCTRMCMAEECEKYENSKGAYDHTVTIAKCIFSWNPVDCLIEALSSDPVDDVLNKYNKLIHKKVCELECTSNALPQ